MRRMIRGATLVLLAWLAAPPAADARLCDVLPMRCSYEGVPFTMTVVDAETRQPLAGVHALAEWQLYGAHGSNGPIMVQDALSDAGGVLRFSAWGPVRGPRVGLRNPNDPVVTLFKPGLEPLVVHNDDAGDAPANARVRRFGRDGQTFALSPFRGTPDEWLAQLQKVARPAATPISDDDLLRFRDPYRRRFRQVWTELTGLPDPVAAKGRRQLLLEHYLRVLEGRQP